MTWKKRCVSLIVCFALIVSITVVRPPKAEAIAFEAGIAVPIILAVAIASGITFLSEGMTESGLTQYIGQQLQSYATDIGTTVSEWWDGLGALGKNDSGQVILSSPFYRGIQQFLSWWRADNGISVGSSNSSVFSDADYFLGCRFIPLDYPSKPSENKYLKFVSEYPDAKINPPYSFSYNGDSYLFSQVSDKIYLYKNGSQVDSCVGTWVILQYISNGDYRFYAGDTRNGFSVLFNRSATSSLSVSQPASYDSLELLDDESVALDFGATVEAGATLEDILAEYLAKIVDNTATAAQEVTTESGEGEGEGDDDDTAPYLPFIPRIWEKLQGLPADIADKVHDLFVPSAAFVEALPAEFADVFDSRCGLLTYPAALLADFLTRLATLTAQEPVLRWGNIKEPFSDRQLITAGSYNLNSAIQTEAMQTVYNVYMICVKAAVAFWFVELCKRKYEKIIRS